MENFQTTKSSDTKRTLDAEFGSSSPIQTANVDKQSYIILIMKTLREVSKRSRCLDSILQAYTKPKHANDALKRRSRQCFKTFSEDCGTKVRLSDKLATPS